MRPNTKLDSYKNTTDSLRSWMTEKVTLEPVSEAAHMRDALSSSARV